MITLYELTCSFALMFIICEVFGKINHGFETISHAMDQSRWYLFPRQIQKILPIVLINAQQIVDFNCFRDTPCNRETFKKVNLSLI